MGNQGKEGTSDPFGPDLGTYQVASKLLDAEKSKWLCGNLLLRIITGSPLIFDMLSSFSEHIEAEIPYLPPDQHTELLQILFVLGTAELITWRGVRFGWNYQEIEELRGHLTQGLNGFFHAYIKTRAGTGQLPDGLESTFIAEMQHSGKYLEQFITRYRELTERQQGPFAGCTHCPAKCLYRPEVQSLLTQKNREWISTELSSESHTLEKERYSSVARAATNIVQSWGGISDKSIAGVAYCATLHTIASSSYTIYEQDLLGNNLHKRFF